MTNKENYSKMTDKQINDLLLEVGEENWYLDEDLLKEGITRWLKLSGFAKSDTGEVGR